MKFLGRSSKLFLTGLTDFRQGVRAPIFVVPVSPATLTEMPKVVIDETEYGLTLMGRRSLAPL